MGLILHFLGNSYIEFDGQKLVFPLRKAESIIFYAALEGAVSRESLKSIFWEDKSDTQSSANLRNALYLIRKAVQGHIKADRRYISLADFTTDLDKLNSITDPNIPVPQNIYSEPLKGLDTSDSEEFYEWAERSREYVKNKLLSFLKKRASACYDAKNSDELQDTLETILRLDPIDEDTVLELMEAYRDTGQAAKAAHVYNIYSKELDVRFEMAPSERASAFFRKIISAYPSDGQDGGYAETGNKFWCRDRELKQMIDALKDVPGRNNIIFIYGEAGIGKTALINKALAMLCKNGETVLASRSSEVGESYPYASWNSIMSRIGSSLEEKNISPGAKTQSILCGVFPGFLKNKKLNYNTDITQITDKNPIVISDMIEDVLRKLFRNKKITIVMEDIHWFDEQSLQLLESFLTSADIGADFIISSRPESSKNTLAMLKNIKMRRGYEITAIQLMPFRRDEIAEICRNSLSWDILKEKGEDYFIRESEGLPLLLFEILRALTENPDSDCTNGLCGLMMDRIGKLSPIQQDILTALSVFTAGAEPAQVAEVTGYTMADILPAAESVISKCLLREKLDDNRVIWDFIHSRVRECIYESISLSKRQDLHRKAAEVLSRNYSPQRWDPDLSAMLRHHYIKSGQKVPELRQCIRELIFDITLNHDLFPVISDNVLLSCSSPFSSRDETEEKIRQAVEILEYIGSRCMVSEEEYANLEASCFELAGGYHISWGEYEKGRVYIDRAIKLSVEHGFKETHIHCLKHFCYMFLQTENAERLLAAARDLLRLAREADEAHYVATAVRLIGVSLFLLKKYDLAEKTFKHSIKLFESLKITGKSYTLGILVAMCYIGEIYQIRGDLKTALSYFSYCVNTCEGIGLYWGRSYFLTHAADVALDMNDMQHMYSYIDKAVSLFEGCQGGRSGPMMYSLKAIADSERGNIDSAVQAIEHAEIFLSAVARKQWMATQCMAKAWVVSKMDEDSRGRYCSGSLDPMSASKWSDDGARLFRECGLNTRAMLIEVGEYFNFK